MNIRPLIALIAASALLWITDSRAETSYGLHIRSAHIPQTTQHNANYGAYVRVDDLVGGCYDNSIKRTSCYFGMTREWGPFGGTVGGITGYDKKHGGHSRSPVAALVALSLRGPEVFGLTPRLNYVPGHLVKSSDVIHLSVEWSR